MHRGGPAGEIGTGLDSPHRAPKLRAHPLPFPCQPAGRPLRSSPVNLQPPEPSEAADDPVAGWVKQIQAGVDVERNFERLYKHFHPRLFASFRRQRLSPEQCEELTQDALFQAFHKIATFEHRSSFSTWLWEIVRNLYLNDWRRRTTAKREGIEMPLAESLTSQDDGVSGVVLAATEPSPYEDAERKEQVIILRDALTSLPPKMQRCAVLRYQENLKYREIATLMSLNIDTVKAHLGQARLVLRERLGPGAGRFIRPGREDEP